MRCTVIFLAIGFVVVCNVFVLALCALKYWREGKENREALGAYEQPLSWTDILR